MQEALDYWNFTRAETLELLGALNSGELSFTPEGSDNWQPLFYQFGCMARTQLVYVKAIMSDRMDLTYFDDTKLPDKKSAQTADEIAKLLNQTDQNWQTALKLAKQVVHWPEGDVSLAGHVYRLVAHERLHHGQIISYFTLAHIDLPPRFKNNWSL